MVSIFKDKDQQDSQCKTWICWPSKFPDTWPLLSTLRCLSQAIVKFLSLVYHNNLLAVWYSFRIAVVQLVKELTFFIEHEISLQN
jgi:hypothetical protein